MGRARAPSPEGRRRRVQPDVPQLGRVRAARRHEPAAGLLDRLPGRTGQAQGLRGGGGDRHQRHLRPRGPLREARRRGQPARDAAHPPQPRDRAVHAVRRHDRAARAHDRAVELDRAVRAPRPGAAAATAGVHPRGDPAAAAPAARVGVVVPAPAVIRRRLREPWALAVGAVVLVAIAFYAWTAATSAPLFPGGDQQDPYNRLVDGFLHGHAYLSVDPPQGLLDLPHPLDPKANQQYVDAQGLRDLSLHDGHLYAYWGAAPAVVAFLPWRVLSVLGVGDLSTAFAALLFSTIGLLCAIAVMRMMVRRWLPDTPVWLQAVAAAMLAFGSYAPWLLRRPEVYEVAISAGFCFVWAGLLCVGASVSRERPRLWLLALGSLFFGLAFASRPPVAVAVAFAVAAGVLMWKRFGLDRVRVILAALAPFGACLVLVAIYN